MIKAYIEPGQPITVLVVEDDRDDYEMIENCLKKCRNDIKIQWLQDGSRALDYIFQRDKFADPMEYPFPALLFLDIRIPKINGIEIVKIIKEDPNLKILPTIMLSTSASPADVALSYENGANSYIKKPQGISEMEVFERTLETYWNPVVLFP